jgi:hypothetical protein
MSEGLGARFGIPESWAAFGKLYPEFLKRFENLKRALDVAFTRDLTTSEPVDRVVLFLGRLCVEDFFEILLLVGNGYGDGALKILRGMYERVVTARYLDMHPDMTSQFLDFHWVQQHKVTNAIRRIYGEKALPSERVEEVESNYQRVKDGFQVELCEQCGRRGLGYTWSSLDFVSMAHATGSTGRLIALGYYLPMRESHSTAGAILHRLQAEADGRVVFDGGPQWKEADAALSTAHNLLLNILDLHKEHFNLQGLEQPLAVCLADFGEVWKPSSP